MELTVGELLQKLTEFVSEDPSKKDLSIILIDDNSEVIRLEGNLNDIKLYEQVYNDTTYLGFTNIDELEDIEKLYNISNIRDAVSLY
jgi:hypothetical protein